MLSPEALSKMTAEELEFHYFSAHDFDMNSKLDGLELLKVRMLSYFVEKLIKNHELERVFDANVNVKMKPLWPLLNKKSYVSQILCRQIDRSDKVCGVAEDSLNRVTEVAA